MSKLKHSDFTDCPECGGSGVDIYNSRTVNIGNSKPHITRCPTCKGSGQIADKYHDLDVPEGYEFWKIINNKAWCRKIKNLTFIEKVNIPTPRGTEVDVACDTCKGRGYEIHGDWLHNHTTKCPSCKGTPTFTTKLDSVDVKQIEGKWKLRERWVEV